MLTYDTQTARHSPVAEEHPRPPEIRLRSLLKWPGNKAQELSSLLPMVPPFKRYYEPFVGAGAMFFALRGTERYINDKSSELIALYQVIAQGDEHFFQFLEALIHQWNSISDFADANAAEMVGLYRRLRAEKTYTQEMAEQLAHAFTSARDGAIHRIIAPLTYGPGEAYFLDEMEKSLLKKMARMYSLEDKKGVLSERDIFGNLESAFKSTFYGYVRHLYNHPGEYAIPPYCTSAIFYFVREMSFASMFRYNQQNEFNVPYGGMSYSRKNIARKVATLQTPSTQAYLAETVIENMDFEQFLRRYKPGKGDFVFIDPPYDSRFNTYCQQEFPWQAQTRLAAYVSEERHAQCMAVVKNTPVIEELYQAPHLKITPISKRYQVSFQGRNNPHAEHLIITNY